MFDADDAGGREVDVETPPPAPPRGGGAKRRSEISLKQKP